MISGNFQKVHYSKWVFPYVFSTTFLSDIQPLKPGSWYLLLSGTRAVKAHVPGGTSRLCPSDVLRICVLHRLQYLCTESCLHTVSCKYTTWSNLGFGGNALRRIWFIDDKQENRDAWVKDFGVEIRAHCELQSFDNWTDLRFEFEKPLPGCPLPGFLQLRSIWSWDNQMGLRSLPKRSTVCDCCTFQYGSRHRHIWDLDVYNFTQFKAY